MEVAKSLIAQRRAPIQWLTEEIQQSTQAVRRHRHMQWSARIINRCSPSQACSPVQCYSAYMVFIEMLVNLKQKGLITKVCVQCLAQRWYLVAGNHHDRTMDFGNRTDWGHTSIFILRRFQRHHG